MRRVIGAFHSKRLLSSKSLNLQDKIVNLCHQRGFVFPGSDLYGGLSGSFDYGPLGVQMKKNIQDSWWKTFIQSRFDCVGLDSSIITNPKVWEKSMHITNFVDPMIQCNKCKSNISFYIRADKLIENHSSIDMKTISELSLNRISQLVKEYNLVCPSCSSQDLQEPRMFNLLFKSNIGASVETSQQVYLRPETAQGAFINFNQVQQSTRRRLPFGIGQMGKSFRNEISPGNFLFRTREFEQLELQYFCHQKDSDQWFQHWIKYCMEWLKSIGLNRNNLKTRIHSQEELAHYALATVDIEYKYSFGWGELLGIANRGNFDLKQHMEGSGNNLEYEDPLTRERYIPYVIEPAIGLNRLFLALLMDAFHVEEVAGRERTVLRLDKDIAPFKCAVLPVIKKPELLELSLSIFNSLSSKWDVDYDINGTIGRRYRRHDEIGTPVCISVDSNSLKDKTVVIRARDSMKQESIPISELNTIWERFPDLNVI